MGRPPRPYVLLAVAPLGPVGYGINLLGQGGLPRQALGVLCLLVGAALYGFYVWYLLLPLDPVAVAEHEREREKSWIHKWRQKSSP